MGERAAWRRRKADGCVLLVPSGNWGRCGGIPLMLTYSSGLDVEFSGLNVDFVPCRQGVSWRSHRSIWPRRSSHRRPRGRRMQAGEGQVRALESQEQVQNLDNIGLSKMAMVPQKAYKTQMEL